MGNTKSQILAETTAVYIDRSSVPGKKTKSSNVLSNRNRAKEARQMKVTARRKRTMTIESKHSSSNPNPNGENCTPVKRHGPQHVNVHDVGLESESCPITPTSQNTQETVTSPDRSLDASSLNMSFAENRSVRVVSLSDDRDRRDDSDRNLSSDEERANISATVSASSASVHQDEETDAYEAILGIAPSKTSFSGKKDVRGLHAELFSLEQEWKTVSPTSKKSRSHGDGLQSFSFDTVSDQDDQSGCSEMRVELAALEEKWKSLSPKNVTTGMQVKSLSFDDSLQNDDIDDGVSHEDIHEEIDQMNNDFDRLFLEIELDEKLSSDTQGNLGDEADSGSLGSNSMFSESEGSDYESLGPYSVSGCSFSVADLSMTPSTASLFIRRSMGSSHASPARSRAESCSSSTYRRRPAKPNGNNVFETLPRHLIKSSLLRQAVSTLRDERFLNRRILRLGAIHAARVHVSDFVCMERKLEQDAAKIEHERTSLEASMPSADTFADGDDLESVTIDSLELFEKCILELCGIQTIEVDITDGEGLDNDESPSSSSSSKQPNAYSENTAKKQEINNILPKILLSDGGRALYALGKYCQKSDWNDDAMQFYKHALYLYFLDLGVEEPRLLDNSDDCDGFFYVKAARECVHESSPTHQYLGTLFTKMGDVHGRCQEKNDALRAYRASEVFWRRYISDLVDMDEVENVNEIVAAVEALALAFNRIGGVYTAKGELEAATVSFSEALEMQLDTLGEDHVEVGKTLHNIGVCHRHNDDWDTALEYYIKAHEILQRNLGTDHLDTVRTLHNIGGVYRRQRQYAKAMECFKEVLVVRRNCLGDDHPSVAITLVSMAAVLRRSGKVDEANKFYAAAVH